MVWIGHKIAICSVVDGHFFSTLGAIMYKVMMNICLCVDICSHFSWVNRSRIPKAHCKSMFNYLKKKEKKKNPAKFL